MRKIYQLLVTAMLFITGSALAQKANQWKDVSEPSNPAERSARVIIPEKFRVLSLDVPGAKLVFKNVRKGGLADAKSSSLIVDLPMPDGSMQQFRVVESPVMEAGLEAKYPVIKTFAGVGITDPSSTARLDFTYKGYHAMILSVNGDVFIDPYSRASEKTYISYRKEDYIRRDKNLNCATADQVGSGIGSSITPPRTIQGQLRTYRLALAATVEYTNFNGGTKAGALSAMVTTMNRVNGVYEVDLAIHMNLVANTDLLIYTGNANKDPYSNTNGGQMLSQNQTTIDNVIGFNNYDIGHVFSTGGGGVAYLGCVCKSNKAGGVTGSPSPIGDGFDIDYVAHEMGHQFGAEHTFNAVSGNCGGGNRSAGSAYEPGSGITVMAYAGICGTVNDLAPHSIAFFHVQSIDQIYTYVSQGGGASCAVVTSNSNVAPVISSIGTLYNIPVNTPFSLSAKATDGNGDAITYSWEEFDLGPAGDWNAPSGDAPIFMPLNATHSGKRNFPSVTNVLNNTNSRGDLKPSYARVLNFKVTVRDNHGGVTYNNNNVQVNVVGTGTPFEITNLNSATTLTAGNLQNVTWNVSATNVAPISTAKVKIYFSTDGGKIFTVIGTAPNNGSYTFTVPNINTTTGRIKIKGAGNIFYDINNANLTITGATLAAIAQMNNAVEKDARESYKFLTAYPNPAKGVVNISFSADKTGIENLVITDLAGRIISQQPINVMTGNNNRRIILPTSITSGIYVIAIGQNKSARISVQK